jgi:regulator of sigma E protease
VLAFLTNFLPTVFILGVLIFVHELGHFLACLASGVRVQKFSIGFGPEVIRRQIGQTIYAISLSPLGGFVKPAGETFSEIEGAAPARGDFLAASRLQRLFILIAGVFMNYVTAFVLLAFVFWHGHPVLKATVGGFVEGYPAGTSGLQVGDEVMALNGQAVGNWQEMTMLIFTNREPAIHLDVKRGADMLTIAVEPKQEESQSPDGAKRPIGRIGILPANQYVTERFMFPEAVHRAAVTTVNLTLLTYQAIGRLVMGQLSMRTLSGPIGIMVMTGNAAQMGLAAVLQLTALISISLAVVNLLPIPALDGGHVLFLLLGLLRGREVSQKIQERVTQVGFAFLMVLMVFVVYNDLVNIGLFVKVRELFGG